MDLSASTCAPAANLIDHHERVRAYEIAAYLSAASFPFAIADGPPASPVPNTDITLNALVQHGVHKMDCDRAFLSLINNRNQYICAEMTKSQPLLHQDPTRPLLLGTACIPLQWGVCPYTMSVFQGRPVDLPDSPYIVADRSYFEIKDFRQIPTFATRPFVAGYPSMVSYIEVPLQSLSGHIIGSYCVVDDKLRDFSHPKVLEQITEVASAICSYLNMKRIEAGRKRSERVMDGLRQFIGEIHTSSSWHGFTGLSGTAPGPFNLGIFGDASHGLASYADHDAKNAQSPENLNTMSPSSLRTSSVSRPDPAPGMSNKITPNNAADPKPQHLGHAPVSSSEPQNNISKIVAPDLPTHISQIFLEAANAIGYAMDLDGLAFFDTTSTGSQYSSGHLPSLFVDGEFTLPVDSEDDPPAKVLSQYWVDDIAKAHSLRQPSQSMVRRWTADFPQGRVFAVDEYGVLNDEDSHAADASHPVAHSRWQGLFEYIPKARYAIFLPLWHYQRESSFATCLAWVSKPGETLDHNDVNSLTAFGNSLMAEIFRLEALANTQSKSDFISSISHELRSPLHGILATVELMKETTKDLEMLSMVDMIQSCSLTLLDTFDHLLKFSKINSRTRDVTGIDKHDSENPNTDASVPVDLGILLEDVLEIVALGHSSALQILSSLDQQVVLETEPIHASNSAVILTAYIENGRNWSIPLNKGAWKRVLLNLCSNALKYTKFGYIDVALRIVKEKDSDHSHICLSVTDTGIGMSAEFLKYHLFTPFMQENSLTPGTGLGLSIVKSIVNSIGGTISVESSLGEGTRITVNVPLDPEFAAGDHPSNGGISDTYDRLKGVSLGFFSVASDGPASARVPHAVPLSNVLERSIRNICEGKFSMVYTTITTDALPELDIVLIDTLALTSNNGRDWTVPPHTVAELPTATALVVLGGPTDGTIKIADGRYATCLISPVTSRRLRAALISALDRTKLASQAAPITLTSSIDNVVSSQPAHTSTQELPIRNLPDESAKDGNIMLNDPSNQAPLSTRHDITNIARLNLASLPEKSAAQEAPFKSAMACRFKRLLLVDDNRINLKVLAAFAKRLGVAHSIATNGAEALRLYTQARLEEETPFDCIFMDISMPVMDGFQAAAAIRQFEQQLPNVQSLESDARRPAGAYIFALTGLGSETARTSARNAGCNMFLLKPVSFKDIVPLLSVDP